MTRWVIVAQLTNSAHVPDVFGSWESEDAAKAAMERLYARIDKSFGHEVTTSVALSVEPIRGKSVADFDHMFQLRAGYDLKADNSDIAPWGFEAAYSG